MNKSGKTIKSVFEADKILIEVFEMTKWSLTTNTCCDQGSMESLTIHKMKLEVAKEDGEIL